MARMRRFLLLTSGIAAAHALLTIVAVTVSIGSGFDLDHPESSSGSFQTAAYLMARVLMQPASYVVDAFKIRFQSSAAEWAVVLLNSSFWGATIALAMNRFKYIRG